MAVALVALLRILLYICAIIIAIGFIAVVFGWMLSYFRKVIEPLSEEITGELNKPKE